MPSVLIYLGRLAKKWMEMVTGGLIAVYLAIQPYTGWAAPHKWIFWSVIAAAWAIASYRVWLDSYRVVEQQRALIAKAGSSEAPRFRLFPAWEPGPGPGEGSLQLMLRNVGKLPVSEFSLRPLRLALSTVEFSQVKDLNPDEDREVQCRVVGALNASQSADLLDLLMVNWTGIDPKDYTLEADVEKQNGQIRTLKFTLSYAPLHNPRRVPHAGETELCLTFTQVSAG
jgi:hypothetical protein